MSHPHQQIYFLEVKKRYYRSVHPHPFYQAKVLDVGSLDVNGNNRFLFHDCDYYGIDVVRGANVDHVMPVHEWSELLLDASYDTIISTSMLEHDMHWKKSLRAMLQALVKGGLLLLACATGKCAEHGTLTCSPESSGTSQLEGEWASYYSNLSEADFRSVIDFDAEFSEYEFKVDREGKDLYFWGLKR